MPDDITVTLEGIMNALKWILVIIALGILSLVSISPFLSEGLPLTDDGNLHIYRSIVLDDTIQNDGSLYPRYTSALAYGYGASLFNYFPPTSYYPTVIFHAFGFDWVMAWKASLIFYVLLAGIGAYLWARQWLDDIGAFITATAYIYAPYTLFDTVTRGSSNEFAGIALLPFALWGFTRLARFGQCSDFLITVFSYALFIMAHNVMTLYGSLLLVAYCGFLLLTSETKFRVFWQMASAGILAILITAFFWLPALTETDLVKINGVLDNLDFIDVTNTLRDLGAVFALPQSADASQLQATVPISFSWVLLILAVIGFFLPQPAQNDPAHRKHIFGLHLLLFAVLGIVTFSQLTVSAEFWQSVRLLQYSQFAWRPMSIGSLVLALLAGIGGSYLLRLLRIRTIKLGTLAIILATIILYSVPWLYRPQIDLMADTVTDAQHYEVASRQITLSSYGEYLPAQTDAKALNPAYFEGDDSRMQENDRVDIVSAEERGTEFLAELTADADTTLIFNWLAVDGWRARIDNEIVEVESIGDAGYVGVDIPSGTHEIRIWYAGTSTQRNATILSILAVIGTVGLAIIYPKPRPIAEGITQSPSLEMMITVALVGLALFGIKAQVIDRIDSPLRASRYQNGVINNVQIPFSVNFGNQIQLLGAELEPSVASGSISEITLFWTLVGEAIETDYSTMIELVDSQGIVIAEASNFYPGGLATRNWLPNHYLEDTITLEIPDYTPPLAYQVRVGVFNSETGQRLDVINADGNPIGVDSLISTIIVEHPENPVLTEDLPLLLRSQGMDLLAVDGLPEQAQVGDEVIFSWVWRGENPQVNLSAQLTWGNSAGVVISPLVIDYPASEWVAGDVWRGYQRIYVPPTLDAGTYNMAITVGGQRAELNQQMSITVPDRDFDLPDFEFEDGTLWQNGITLLGYDTDEGGITLYWQTQELLDENLRLFVQVFGSGMQMLAIDDEIPVDFQRPTTGWVTVEIISTRHEFENLDAGSYIMLIGWYDILTDRRVLLDTEDTPDALELDYFP